MNATITRKSRNIGIAASAHVHDGPNGWYFPAATKPDDTGGCATIRRELNRAAKRYGYSTYYRVDLFVNGKLVAHDTGDAKRIMEFCRDRKHREHGYMDDSITVQIDTD